MDCIFIIFEPSIKYGLFNNIASLNIRSLLE